MIKSMTGFGRCEVSEGDRKITVEMKSVNHRYLDVSIKMPKKLNFFDSAIRSVLKEYMERGKVDVYVSYEDLTLLWLITGRLPGSIWNIFVRWRNSSA